jgi:type I restriction enzyme S subunit
MAVEKVDVAKPELPSGWKRVPLSKLVSPDRPKIKPTNRPELPFIGMEHVESNTMTLLGTVPAETMKSNAVHFQPGDVLYGRLRPYLNKVYRPTFEGLCSAEFIVMPENDEIYGKYLQYFLNSSQFVNFASHLKEGDRPRVNFKMLSPYEVPVPATIEDQKRIVAEIEKQFSRLDEAIAGLKCVKANLKRYKAAVLKAAVEGKLTEEWRKQNPDVEPASKLLERILDERRAKWEEAELAKMRAKGKEPKNDRWKEKYREPDQPEAASLGQVPQSWCFARLDNIAEIKGGITKDSKRKLDNIEVLPYLRVANVQRGFIDLSEVKEIEVPEEKVGDLLLEGGDILFNEGGDRDKLGRGWVWEDQLPRCIHQNHVFRARLYLDEVQPKFVSWYGNSFGQRYFMASGKQTTNLASINKTMLSALPMPLPPAEEQAAILTICDGLLSNLDVTEHSVATSLGRAVKLRQSALAKAFSGRLDANISVVGAASSKS